MNIDKKIQVETANSLSEYFNIIENYVKRATDEETIYFRGESSDYKTAALTPSVYRNDDWINSEEKMYRELSRFNNLDFKEDITTFDKLSRMQHYGSPTRLIDLSDDPLTSLWFSKSGTNNESPCVYIVKVKKSEIKYADSDTVTVLSNLVKIGMKSDNHKNKNKKQLAEDTLHAIKNNVRIKYFNKQKSVQFLLHEIRNDINHFEPIIKPTDLASVICVKPKLTNTRIRGQKGSFLLFGLNIEEEQKSIPIIRTTKENELEIVTNDRQKIPIMGILKIKIGCGINKKMLEKIGITEPFIYPD